ncbi:chaplin [Streptomyces griseoruber]|uniref:Tat pathway signal protein n=1 Tax=Streptomyces griseoruber TaxID=1943 RepID=A0A117R8N1_9ACTN|nr:chaplin [Streptomyces griseoruber]KUN77159.1 Tat pathway signal protein [Streptomyces griseoruber]
MRQVTRKSLMTVAAATGVIAAAGGYAHADSGANGFATDSPGVASGNTVQAPVNVPVNVCGNTIDVVGLLNPAFGNSCATQGGRHRAPGGYGDSDHAYGGGQHGGGHGGGHGGNGGGHWGGQHGGHGGHDGGYGAYPGSGGAQAGGHTGGSPGVGSGNHVQAPIDVPVNVCGNSVDGIGILNPSYGNDCDNGGGHGYGTPPDRGHETPGTPGHHTPGKPVGHGSTPSGPEAVPSTPGRGTPAHSVTDHRPTGTAGTVAGGAQLAETGSELPLGLALPAGAGALLAGALLYRKARTSL